MRRRPTRERRLARQRRRRRVLERATRVARRLARSKPSVPGVVPGDVPGDGEIPDPPGATRVQYYYTCDSVNGGKPCAFFKPVETRLVCQTP